MNDLSNENIIHMKKDNIEFLQFKKLLEYSDIINHAYSVGLELNFSTSLRKDNKPIPHYFDAIGGYKKLCTAIGSNYINIVKPLLNHTCNVKSVYCKKNKTCPDFNLSEYTNTDGLITNRKNLILSTTNADCILLLFFDPVKKVIANVHSGWRGTLKRICINTLEKMKADFSCNPQDIICCICPSIRKCHFEVDAPVKNLFYEEFKNFNVFFKNKNINKWYIDTVEINKILLYQSGLKEENIIDSNICSFCNSDIIHSYRIEKENLKLETAIIELKK